MASFEHCTGYLVTPENQWVPAVQSGSITETATALGADFISAFGARTFFSRGQAPREWSVNATGPYSWARSLKALQAAGAQRLYWVSPLGVHTNILPSSKPLQGASTGVRMIDGHAVELFLQTSDWPASPWVPCQPGQVLHGSAYQAGGEFFIEFRDAGKKKMPVQSLIPAPYAAGLVEAAVTVPENAVEVHLASKKPIQVGGYALRLETHGISQPAESSCAWVSMHDLQVSHGNIAFPHSPVNISFTLKEVA